MKFLAKSLAILGMLAPLCLHAIPAFPGAQGWGADATGGRNGTVVHVTNTNSSGSGSFAAALAVSGAKIIVFDVGGVINLQNQTITLTSNTTVAGQTAPGGITLRNGGIYTMYQGNYTNMIMRFIRVRRSQDVADGDCFRISHCSNYILDHCSGSWNSDETIDIVNSNTGTFQYCIFAEPCECYEHYGSGSGNGNMRTLCLGSTTDGRITFYRNLLASSSKRCPFLSNMGATGATGKTYEVINNVFYNNFQNSIESFTDGNNIPLNLIKNYYKAGLDAGPPFGIFWSHNGTTPPSMYCHVRGNRNHDYMQLNDSLTPQAFFNATTCLGFNATPFAPMKTTVISTAVEAYPEVLSKAGVQPRDSADRRIAYGAYTKTGHWIMDCEPGTDPLMTASGTRPADTDNDGMPNAWETAKGLNPNSASDNMTDRDGDGYKNIEEYINALADSLVAAAPPVGTDIESPAPAVFGPAAISACPQPFALGGVFRFSVNGNSRAVLNLYDLRGRLVRSLWAGNGAGVHTVVWDGRNTAGHRADCGIYTTVLKTGDKVNAVKITVVR